MIHPYMIMAIIVFVVLGWTTTKAGKMSVRRKLDLDGNANLVTMFPLTWRPLSGVFTLQFTVGQNKARITAVPDTGSEYLIVGGKNCASCDSSQGVYDESGVDTGDTQVAVYGSQTDEVSWFIDDITVAGVTEPLNVEFGTITAVSGSTNLNILGLVGSETTTDKTPFINQVMYSQQIIPPSFVFDMTTSDNATLTLGATSDGVSGNTVNLLTRTQAAAMIGNDLGIAFYLIHVKGILVDGNAVESPAVCMLDSGSTDLVCSTALGNTLRNFETLELQFDTFSLTYTSEMARNIEPEPDFDNKSTYNGQVLILGNQFWLGRTFSFDLKDSQLTVSTPDPATM